MIKYGDTMMHLISKLRKGHQMQFWMFYWSSTDETAWREEVVNLKNKYNKQYPQEVRIMRLAFEFFENGIDYPQLLPHLENQKFFLQIGNFVAEIKEMNCLDSLRTTEMVV